MAFLFHERFEYAFSSADFLVESLKIFINLGRIKKTTIVVIIEQPIVLLLSFLVFLKSLEIVLIDLEDKVKISTIEKATSDKNYTEKELFTLYERFKFNINQLLTVEESYKLLSGPESRALVYQGILISKESSEKIKLIKLLKDLFKNDGISEAFDAKLAEFLEEVDREEVPSDYTDFYNSNKI